MKSHSCVKTPGGGVCLPSEPNSQPVPPELETSELVTSEPATCKPVSPEPVMTPAAVTLTRCRHIDRLGRNCRLHSTIPNLELCPHHARQLEKQHQRHNDNTAAELLGDLTDFSTPDAINALLGNLVRQLARKRIARLDAIAIAYVAQLLLGSISSMDRHDAALRTAEDANADDFPTRLVFDRPAELDPTTTAAAYSTSDSLRIAASFGARPTSAPQNTEGRA
jgi:hypothetical protein